MFGSVRKNLLAVATGLCVAVTAGSAAAYPDRPIKLIVPWGAGGGTDTLARTFAKLMEDELGQPINVVNRTGAGGVVGHSAMAHAQPDGYTIGVGTVEFTTYKALGQSDITPESFTLLRRLASLPAGITVRDDAPWDGADELLKDIKAEPAGTYSSSGSGVGGAWHLSVAGWLNAEGVDPLKVRFVPSKGGAPALRDVVAGGITMYTGSISEGESLRDAGKVKYLGIMHSDRMDSFPEVPTIEQQTGTPWAAGSWFSFMAPAGLEPEVRKTLIQAANTVHASDEFQQFMKNQGYVPASESGEAFETFAREVSDNLAEVIRKLGLGQDS